MDSRQLSTDLEAKIDWSSQDSHLLLNPTLSMAEKEDLVRLARKFSKPGTIWIASSGSSKKQDESLKLIALTKTAMRASSVAVNEHLHSQGELARQDVWLQALPRFHVGGLSIELRAQLSGAKVISAVGEKWSAQNYVNLVEKEKVTLSALVPTQVHDLVQADLHAPKSLRAIVIGGAALGESVYEKGIALGWPLLPSFGLTECASQVATAEIGGGPRLRVLSHCQVDTDAGGFLKIQSPALFTGFAQRRGLQDEWHPRELSGSWWLSSDRVELTVSVQTEASSVTYLRPLGRENEFVKIKGEGVHLAKLRENLDRLLLAKFHAASLEVTLLDLAHDRDGAELVLVHGFSVSKAEATQILQAFNAQSASLEKLSRVVQAAKIPRSSLGKIQWEELRLSLTI